MDILTTFTIEIQIFSPSPQSSPNKGEEVKGGNSHEFTNL
jgi:hypothetical protein